MSQGLKLKFFEMLEGDPTKSVANPGVDQSRYGEPGHGRHVCFIWPDGRQFFLNYSHLVTGEYLPEPETILLTFTSHIVKITGLRLQHLLYDLLQSLPRYVLCVEERYRDIAEETAPFVSGIEIASVKE